MARRRKIMGFYILIALVILLIYVTIQSCPVNFNNIESINAPPMPTENTDYRKIDSKDQQIEENIHETYTRVMKGASGMALLKSILEMTSDDNYETALGSSNNLAIKNRTFYLESVEPDSATAESNMNELEQGEDILSEIIPMPTQTPTPKSNPIVQSMVLTYWRSGSSFLGEILHSIPGSYYSFEPLMYLGTIKIRDQLNLTKGVDTLRHILHCNYTGMDDYFNFRGFSFVTSHNIPLWKSCGSDRLSCKDPQYMSKFCSISPYQITKVVRLLVEHAEPLLTEPGTNVKMLLLIRDPRGTMGSRNREQWCRMYPDCGLATHLCRDLVADYKAAKKLTEKYPDRFKVIRYEDLSLDPFNMTTKILEFYGLPFHDEVKKFLNTHTQNNQGGSLSTFRDSKRTPFNWMQEMSFTDVQRIQADCREALSLWGYKNVEDEVSLKNNTFNPLGEFPFSIDEEELDTGTEIEIVIGDQIDNSIISNNNESFLKISN